MASGHVNRTRPNTWLHRPATRREDSPCQLGAVHTWHFCDVRIRRCDVWFRSQSGRPTKPTLGPGRFRMAIGTEQGYVHDRATPAKGAVLSLQAERCNSVRSL
jgi:hypothetical protein